MSKTTDALDAFFLRVEEAVARGELVLRFWMCSEGHRNVKWDTNTPICLECGERGDPQ